MPIVINAQVLSNRKPDGIRKNNRIVREIYKKSIITIEIETLVFHQQTQAVLFREKYLFIRFKILPKTKK